MFQLITRIFIKRMVDADFIFCIDDFLNEFKKASVLKHEFLHDNLLFSFVTHAFQQLPHLALPYWTRLHFLGQGARDLVHLERCRCLLHSHKPEQAAQLLAELGPADALPERMVSS